MVCGNGDGALMIYNWGLWNDITDRYPVHSQSIDCLVALNENVVCTGCMDGWIRYSWKLDIIQLLSLYHISQVCPDSAQ